MIKTLKLRIYPTKKQIKLFNQTLETCRSLYNHLLSERKNSWEKEKKSLNYFAQLPTIIKLKEEQPNFSDTHSQVLQNVANRIDSAFKHFFRRVKNHEKPGYPRFRGQERYNSFTYPQDTGFELKPKISKIRLGKIGSVKFRNKIIEGEPKTCTISKNPVGKWYASISYETKNPERTRILKTAIGIDMGLESFVTFSDGTKIENPRFFRTSEKKLAKYQRKLSKLEKSDPKRTKAKKIVSRIHERIKNKRTNFTHQESRKIVDKFGIICVEDLSINQMVHNHCLAKSISDAAWSQFLNQLNYKAEWAGRKLIKVNPAYTSQNCSQCGHREPKTLGDRIHNCPCCGFTLDRDHNAALNILALGLQSSGSSKSLEA